MAETSVDEQSVAQLISAVVDKPTGDPAPMYIYATESIASYYDLMDLTDSRVLTIAGSGDQIINAYAHGAAAVTGIDYNVLSYYMVQLKLTALRCLSYEEFLQFFGNGEKPTLPYQLYQHVAEQLPDAVRAFWNRLYRHFAYNGRALAASGLFHHRPTSFQSLQMVNTYLRDAEQFKNAQEQVKRGTFAFHHADIVQFVKQITERFDVVNLSNAPNFLIGIRYAEEADQVTAFYSDCLLPLSHRLSKSGSILLYIYSPDNYPNPQVSTPPPLTEPAEREKLHGNVLTVEEQEVPGWRAEKDLVMVLRKQPTA